MYHKHLLSRDCRTRSSPRSRRAAWLAHTSYSIILYYTILYYLILYYIILCYITFYLATAVLDPVLVVVEQLHRGLAHVDAHRVSVGLHPARCELYTLVLYNMT
jgi:hypothetical protein